MIKSENPPVYQDTKKNGMNVSLVGVRNHKNRRNSSFHRDKLIKLTIREYLIKNNNFFYFLTTFNFNSIVPRQPAS